MSSTRSSKNDPEEGMTESSNTPRPSQRRRARVAVSLVCLLLVLLAEYLLRQMTGNLAISQLLRRVEDPELCFAPVPERTVSFTGVLHKFPGPVQQEFNAEGYRGPAVAPTPLPDTLRIAVLGDSYTYGFGVEEPDTFVRLVEQDLRARRPQTPPEVVNFGVPGYNTFQYARWYVTKVRALRPQVVVIFHVENDVVPSDCELGWTMPFSNGPAILEHSYLARMLYLLPREFTFSRKAETTDLEQELTRHRAAFDRLTAAVAQDGARLFVVVLTDRNHKPAFNIAITDEFERLQIPWVSIAPLLQEGPDSTENFLVGDESKHFSVAGHRRIAAATARWLDEQLPPQ